MRRLLLLVPAAFLAGCAVVGEPVGLHGPVYGGVYEGPAIAYPYPYPYSSPGYGWSPFYGYGGAYWGRPYVAPHRHSHSHAPTPRPAVVPRAAAPAPEAVSRPRHESRRSDVGHGEEAHRQSELPRLEGRRPRDRDGDGVPDRRAFRHPPPERP